MANIEFMHMGITVSDLDKMTAFYEKYLGFKAQRSTRFDEGFISDSPTLYRQPAGVYSDMRMLSSDFGVTLELFQFSNTEKSPPFEWPMTGYHHLAFKVESIPALYEQMIADGIEFFFPPKKRGASDAHWIFFKDPDGNMIELWD
ncbi:MAG: VOC family protein [Clostridiales bacterium]|nr:VOC family protein [Clostridiales bacterium]